MKRWFLPLVAVLATLAVACGGGSDGATAPSAVRTPTARATSGPSISVSPKSAPPGSEITMSGSGWAAGTEVSLTAGEAGAKPYATVITDQQGAFRKSFFLEKMPDGTALETGRLDLIATAGGQQVEIPFIVEVRRPVPGPGPGG